MKLKYCKHSAVIFVVELSLVQSTKGYPRSEAEWDPTLHSETNEFRVSPTTKIPACKGNQSSLKSLKFTRNKL